MARLCFRVLVVSSLVSATLSLPSVDAQCFEATFPGILFDGTTLDSSVDLNGDRLVVGAPSENGSAGSVRVYRRFQGEWLFETELISSTPRTTGLFGRSVSIDEEWIAVGANGEDTDGVSTGAVHLFRFDGKGWSHWTRLTPDVPGQFGFSVALDLPWLAIGAPKDNTLGAFAGALHTYQHVVVNGIDDFWVFDAKHFGSETEFLSQFGHSVSLLGERMVVGAPFHQVNEQSTGRGFVFDLDEEIGWSEDSALLSPVAGSQTFGFAVSQSTDEIIVGAPEIQGQNFGSVHVFTPPPDSGASWTLAQTLTAPDQIVPSNFGRSLETQDGRLVVGNHGSPTLPSAAGAFHLFVRNVSWEAELMIESPSPDDLWFGRSVAIDETRVGTITTESAGSIFGAIHVLDFQEGLACPTRFSRGDLSEDGTFGLDDVVIALEGLFLGGPIPCDDALDANDNGLLDLADPVGLAAFVFLGGAPPGDPAGFCDSDPTPDGLDCEQYACP